VGVLSLDDLLRLIATEVGDLAEAIRRQLSQPSSPPTASQGAA
jgi:hypothetical protein